jgi:hypothetical protein
MLGQIQSLTKAPPRVSSKLPVKQKLLLDWTLRVAMRMPSGSCVRIPGAGASPVSQLNRWFWVKFKPLVTWDHAISLPRVF